MKLSDIEMPSNRKFGLFFSVVFSAFGIYFFNCCSELVGLGFGVFALGFGLAALIIPKVLFPLNKVWMCFGLLLGSIVSPIVLGIIFFLIFTPIGLCMRLCGRDELRLKVVKSDSYWKSVDESASSSESFKYQF
jgi:hypothetical protein